MNIVNAGGRYQVYGEDVQTYKTLPAGDLYDRISPADGVLATDS